MAYPLEDAPDGPQLSVVVPTYGGERTLPILVDRLRKALDGQSYEIVLVHDCGPDESWATISGLAKADDRIRGINLRKNFGQHNAVMAGLNYARGGVIVTMDDDLQHSPDDIAALREKLNEGYDVCYARFTSRKHAAWKVFGSKVNDWLARALLGKPKGIYLSPYRCLSRSIRDELVKFKGPSVYIDGLIIAITDNIASVDVAHQERSKGESQYTLRKSISLLLKMATSGSIFPLRLASLLGLLTSFVGFILALVFAIQRIEDPTLPIGWASLIVTSLFLGGVQLLALGILGEYIGGLFLRVDARPQYVVADITDATAISREGRETSAAHR